MVTWRERFTCTAVDGILITLILWTLHIKMVSLTPVTSSSACYDVKSWNNEIPALCRSSIHTIHFPGLSCDPLSLGSNTKHSLASPLVHYECIIIQICHSVMVQSRNCTNQKPNYNTANGHGPLLTGLARLCSTCVNDELTFSVFPAVSFIIKPPVSDSAGELGPVGDDGELHLLSRMLPLQLSRLYTTININ